jgi:hypothetical protein
MDVVSQCPFQASAFVWYPNVNSFALTVLCKATFDLRPNQCVLSAVQEPLNLEESYLDNDPTRSVRMPNDYVPHKLRADILLTGHAYAPNRQPVRSIVTRLLVGDMDKSIEVWCDRGFRIHDNQLLEGPRFAQMPLRWERAAGGPETNNPVGIRFDGAPDRYGMVALPNLQPIGMYVSQRSDTFTPIGFGPMSARWPGRLQKLGRYALSFSERTWKDAPLPAPFDYGYFNAAPPDQQVKEIRSNERIILENLHREHSRLVTNLPGLTPRAVADRATGEREDVRLVADTLSIDTDRDRITLVWRGTIGLRNAREGGRITLGLDGATSKEPAVQSATPIRVQDDGFDATLTLMTPIRKKEEPALPFVPGASAMAVTDKREAAVTSSQTSAFNPNGTMLVPNVQAGGKALPFDQTNTLDDGDMAKTLPPVVASSGATPFVPAMPMVPVLPPMRLGFGALSGDVMPPVALENAPKPTVIEVHEPAPQEIAPPAMIGPLATTEMAERTPEKNAAHDADEEPKTPPKAVVKNEPAKKFNPADFPLEKCAALTASIARRKAEKATILEAEELTAEQWAAVEKHWAGAIKEETTRGKRTLMDRFDQAYVTRLEEERGPITVEEYARTSVAGERGTLDDVLRELGLPKGAVMRVERVWMKRLAWDPGLADSVDEAMSIKRQN